MADKAQPKQEKKQKKQRRSVVGGIARRFANVPLWVNMTYIKETNTSLFGYLKNIFKIDKSRREESFEQALQRLGVGEADLKAKAKTNRINMFVFGTGVVLMVVYSGYLLFTGSIRGTILALAVTILLLVKTYQYSFWNFQIKHRKLGCTFKEWLNGKVNSETSPIYPENND